MPTWRSTCTSESFDATRRGSTPSLKGEIDSTPYLKGEIDSPARNRCHVFLFWTFKHQRREAAWQSYIETGGKQSTNRWSCSCMKIFIIGKSPYNTPSFVWKSVRYPELWNQIFDPQILQSSSNNTLTQFRMVVLPTWRHEWTILPHKMTRWSSLGEWQVRP